MPRIRVHKFPHRRPDTGLISQYWPFILKVATKYAQLHFLPVEDVLDQALRLAAVAEEKFKPELGYDFSTLLRWHLKGLHRFCKREYQGRRGAMTQYAAGVTLSRGWNPIDGGDGVWRQRTTPIETYYYNEPSRRRRLVRWRDHRAALIQLEQRQRQSLRLTEKAVLDWMLDRGGRKLSEVATWMGRSKGYASKIRYNLIRKAITAD